MADDSHNKPDDAFMVDETSEATMIVDSAIIRQVREGHKKVRASLVVLSGPEVGRTFSLDEDEVVVGRSVEATLRIHEAGISRKHTRVLNKGPMGVYIEDLASANGTFVNGERLGSMVQLRDGDKITLGSSTILKFAYHDQLDQSFQKRMYEAALCDSMTGAYNKKYFTEQLDKEFAYAQRHNSKLSLIMFDVDHFTKVNTVYGHPGGDVVLIRLSEMAADSVRAEDIFARYGGEEFAIICRGVGMRQAAKLGDRLRREVEREVFEHNGRPISITISVGVAGLPDVPVDSADEMVEAADVALYAAKNSGRNRVMFATHKKK